MKNTLKYPRTTTELNRLLNILDLKIKEMEEEKTKKNKSREWIRICHAANDIRKNAILESSKAKESNTLIKNLFNFNNDIHDRIIKDLERWMKINKFPIW